MSCVMGLQLFDKKKKLYPRVRQRQKAFILLEEETFLQPLEDDGEAEQHGVVHDVCNITPASSPDCLLVTPHSC